MPPKKSTRGSANVTTDTVGIGAEQKSPKTEEEKADGPPPPRPGDQPTMKNFCNNIKADNTIPPDIKRLLVLAKTRNEDYNRCQGTTTVFGDKECMHRQCHCITKNAARTYVPDRTIFSEAEIVALAKLVTIPYQICHRHSPILSIPFAYLKALNLDVKDMEEEIRGGIVRIRQLSVFGADVQTDILLDQLQSLVPYLTRISRQEAADARASLKRAIDEFSGSIVDERPAKRRRLEALVEVLYQQIDGTADSTIDTGLEVTKK
jgi:hypothetical protein